MRETICQPLRVPCFSFVAKTAVTLRMTLAGPFPTFIGATLINVRPKLSDSIFTPHLLFLLAWGNSGRRKVRGFIGFRGFAKGSRLSCFLAYFESPIM